MMIQERIHSRDVELPRDSAAPSGDPAAPPPGLELVSGPIVLSVGDLGAELAALIMSTARDERKANTELRRAEETAIETAENQQIDAMRDEASHTRAAGWVEGGLEAVGGAVTLNCGLAHSKTWSGLAEVSKGAAGVLGGECKALIADDNAAGAEVQALAGHHKRALEDVQDAIGEARDLSRAALEFHKDFEQTKNQTILVSVSRN